MNESFELNEFIQSIIKKYTNTVLKTAFAYLRNTADAEDITQDVFLTLYEKKPDFQSEEHLKAWLIRVAINKSKNYIKCSWFKTRNPIPDDLAYLPSEESELLGAVLSLKIKYRLPVHLYYYEGYSIKEISAILSIPEATVGTRLSRGRKILKEILGGFEDE